MQTNPAFGYSSVALTACPLLERWHYPQPLRYANHFQIGAADYPDDIDRLFAVVRRFDRGPCHSGPAARAVSVKSLQSPDALQLVGPLW
ncbi:DUF3322 domain-containing protein [Parvibium lacunae]|uniref:DUF3322 domain-containing protein n=1 Tax=Parvibium lacunae TaxID=1888893 RepID=UPI003B833695